MKRREKNNAYTLEFKMAIGKDFHFTSMSGEELGAKYDVSADTARCIGSNWDPAELRQLIKIEKERKHIIILDGINMDLAINALNSNKIDYEVPVDYELELKFNSKINNNESKTTH